MGNTEAKAPKGKQKLRVVRKSFDSPRKLAIIDIEPVTPDGSPRYKVTVKDRGLRTKSVEIKNKRNSREDVKDWLDQYPDSKIVMFDE